VLIIRRDKLYKYSFWQLSLCNQSSNLNYIVVLLKNFVLQVVKFSKMIKS